MSLDEDDNFLRFLVGTLSCTWVSGQKSQHTPFILDLFAPVLPSLSAPLICVPRPIPLWFTTIFSLNACLFYFLFSILLCFFPLHLVHLEGVSPSSSASSHGKDEYLFQRQEQREAASGQKHPSIRPPPFLCLPPSSASSQGSVLSGCEWMKVILWLTGSQTHCCCSSSAVQTVTRCSAFACFSCVYSCVDQEHQRSPAANWYCGFHACMQARGMCIRLWVLDGIWEPAAAAYNSVIDADPKKASSLLSLKM